MPKLFLSVLPPITENNALLFNPKHYQQTNHYHLPIFFPFFYLNTDQYLIPSSHPISLPSKTTPFFSKPKKYIQARYYYPHIFLLLHLSTTLHFIHSFNTITLPSQKTTPFFILNPHTINKPAVTNIIIPFSFFYTPYRHQCLSYFSHSISLPSQKTTPFFIINPNNTYKQSAAAIITPFCFRSPLTENTSASAFFAKTSIQTGEGKHCIACLPPHRVIPHNTKVTSITDSV